VRSIKAVQFRYAASAELSSLFEDFRLMCNDAIRIAIREKPKDRFQLIKLAYPRLKQYDLHTHYILSACEVAYSTYCNKNRRNNPYVHRAFLKIDSQSYRLDHLILRIPTAPRNFIYLTLQASDYQLALIDNPTLKRCSVTVTERTLAIVFSKEVTIVEPLGNVGIDVNERNVTESDSLGRTVRHDTSEIAELKERYKAIRTRIGERTRQDNRVSKKLYAKYGRRERNRTNQAIHEVSKKIVRRAKDNHLGIVMEKLKGIRKLYRRGNGQGANYRGRMNSWTFRELQRQVDYKARWEGLPITYVNPRNTSRNCSKCGSQLEPRENRQMSCPRCGRTWDRDVNASRNIMMAAQVRAARPPRGSGEGESRRQEKAGNPPSR
jgi:putative transposase